MSSFVRENLEREVPAPEREDGSPSELGGNRRQGTGTNSSVAANAALVRSRRGSTATEDAIEEPTGDVSTDPEKFWEKYDKLKGEATSTLEKLQQDAWQSESATTRFLAGKLVDVWREVVAITRDAQNAYEQSEMDEIDRLYQEALAKVDQVSAEGIKPEVSFGGASISGGKLGLRLEVTEGSTEDPEVSVTVEYSVDGGATFSPASMYSGVGTISVAVGELHHERWFSENDLTERPSGAVVIRAAATSGEGTGPSVTTTIDGENIPLVAPKSGRAPLPYDVSEDAPTLTLGDLEGEPVGEVDGAEAHPEAYAELLAFMAQTHSVLGYDPKLDGLTFDDQKGLFDATYVPSQKLLVIDQRIRFGFGEDGKAWESEEAKEAAKQEILTQIEGFWQARHSFECAREPREVWGSLGPIQVDIRLHDVAEGEHFTWQVNSSYEPSAGVGSEINTAFVTEPTIDPLTRDRQFGRPGLEQAYGDPVASLAAGELEIVSELLVEPFEFVSDSQLTTGSRERAELLAKYLGDMSDPSFLLELGGPGKKAQHLLDVLTDLGAGANHELVLGEAVAGDGVAIAASIRSAAGLKYSVAHEAGHTFGLGDVYGHAQVGHQDHGSEHALAPHHGLVAKAFGEEYADMTASQRSNKSMMGGGIDVRAYEYVTFWDALVQATSAAGFSAEDWKFSGGGD